MTRQQRLVLVVAILASFIGGLDGFIVNVVLPAISRDLGGGLVVQQWTVDAYLLTLGSLILIAGSLSDLFGRSKILAIGLWGFLATSLLCAIAPSGLFLVVARALQGVAGALLVPSSLAMIMANFDGPAKGKAIGTWTAWITMSAIAGPLLGGIIISFATWRWVFAVNVVPIAVTLWLLRILQDADKGGAHPQVDYKGAFLCAAGLAGSVYALIEQPKYGWFAPVVWLPFVLGLVVFTGFVRHEHNSRQPMLPLGLFRNRNFAVGNIATLAIYAGLATSSFIITITLQQVAHYSALEAGLAMLPVTAAMFFLSSRFGALAGKYGPRLFMTVGPLLAAIGFLLMLRVGEQVQYVTALLPGLVVFALGLSATVAPLTAAILGDIERGRSGVASAVNNAVARIAGLLAIALVGVITGPHLDIAGFHRVLIAVACLLIVGGLVSLVGIRTPPKGDVA